MKCPICAQSPLQRQVRDMPYTYKGHVTVIEKVSGQFCPRCGESVLEAAEASRVSAAMLAFNKQSTGQP